MARRVRPEAESEAAPLVGIDAAHAQNVGMHQAARQQLHPAALLAHRATGAAADQALDIELEARFDEGEIAGPQPHRDLALKMALSSVFMK